MLPQSTEDESASDRLGDALTISWAATLSRTYRKPSYRGRIREKYRTPCNLPGYESAVDVRAAIVQISQSRFRGVALSMPAICLSRSVSSRETVRPIRCSFAREARHTRITQDMTRRRICSRSFLAETVRNAGKRECINK